MKNKIQNVFIGFLWFQLFFLFPFNEASAQKIKRSYHTRSSSAIRYFEEAQTFYEGRSNQQARELLEKAIRQDSTFIEAHILLAGVLTDLGKKEDAITAYKKSISLDPEFFTNNYYNLAVLQIEVMQYEEAYANFQTFLSYPASSGMLSKAKKNIETADFGRKAMQHPVPYAPVNLGDSINTKYGEYSPAITADDHALFFTSFKPASGGKSRKEDIFVSEKINGTWSFAHSIGAPVNNPEYNTGTVCIAPDGFTLYYTACGRPDGFGSCDIYEVRKTGDRWGTPHNLGPNVNSPSFDSQPSIASDGRTLYFSSSRAGGQGKLDLWKTVKQENGSWSTPVNLGQPVNTPDNEQSPFIHPDNTTLYFISDGLPGMGGFDFYLSRNNGKDVWSNPLNLGYPINTSGNERNLIVNTRGDLAYMASDRNKEKDDFDLCAFDLYPEARPSHVLYLNGIVYDSLSKKKLEARFQIIDLESGLTSAESFSDPVTGAFLVCLPIAHNYALNVSAPGYLFYSDNFSLKNSDFKNKDSFQKNVPMQILRVGEKVVLKNIFFETNSFQLKDESMAELGKLFYLLNQNEKLKIEISGHTDNVGDSKSNLTLSSNRAKAVSDYLVLKGIPASRLSSVGFGETKPIASNDSPDGRSLNRRTEFKVVE